MLFSRVTLLLMSSTYKVLPSGVSMTLFGQLFVAPVIAVRLLGLIWSFSGSMSSYLASSLSLSLAVLTCLLVVVFLSQRYLLSFVLRRPAFALLVVPSVLAARLTAPPLLPTLSRGVGRLA